MELIIGATILLPISAATSALLIKHHYFSQREEQAQLLLNDYNEAYLDLEEIFAEGCPAMLGIEYEESTDLMSILASAAEYAAKIERHPFNMAPPTPIVDLQPVVTMSSELVPYSNVPKLVKRYTIRKRRPKHQIAYALAQEAYYNFGARPRSEANNLITRRWMKDRLEEYNDIRFVDRASIIDIALVLSFLPSNDSREIENLSLTNTFIDRSTTVPLYRLFRRLLPSTRQDVSRAPQ
jgi:hypothetical protein